jgi:hypothetical protein
MEKSAKFTISTLIVIVASLGCLWYGNWHFSDWGFRADNPGFHLAGMMLLTMVYIPLAVGAILAAGKECKLLLKWKEVYSMLAIVLTSYVLGVALAVSTCW